MTGNVGITCQLCHANTHIIHSHLKKSHPDYTVEKYQAEFPDAPLMSEAAEAELNRRRGSEPAVTVIEDAKTSGVKERALHEVFGFGSAKAALNARGEPIGIMVYDLDERSEFVPEKDPGYIFDIALTKIVIQAFEMNIPAMLWGHAGTGKSTIVEQVCAFTNRKLTRIQHTANTEEADVEGQWIVNAKGEMEFQLGPLPLAMLNGDVYCADEYDFANPQVLAVYQAVLEGKPLRIKACNRIIHPHANFRFIATGNTNGSGDEYGLYMGTQIQNSANYERFGIVHKVEYMAKTNEVSLLQAKVGLDKTTAEKMVEFAWMMRASFDKKEVASPLSPRSLQFAAKLGLARRDFRFGIENAYINRLPATSAEFAKQVMQRHFS